ncbi:cell wall-active antibiotics response protein LiaF [Virgibacillus kekensis]|uniref:Cell wall-active antibiotics response protein LiaF n=1 Tax=Virgibacillus kekensis TaxID=202261 RepID=A0ABV9DIR1_9BACI
MFNRLSTDTFNWILIIGVILFVIEIAFFHGGMIISALFAGFFIYIGRKKFSRLWGKVFFWFGVAGLVFAILNTLAVRFLIIAAIVLFIINYSKSKKEAEIIRPEHSNVVDMPDTPLKQSKPLFDHKIFGDQATEDTAYQWGDLNIHAGVGDRMIDLSNTVLPNDTAVISIRHIVGNVQIYVPYEVEVSIHHSAIFGRATIFNEEHMKLMNESLLYQTEGYTTSMPRVKIITSFISGDIEVMRI